MTSWELRATRTFSQTSHKLARTTAFTEAFDKKLKRLRENPQAVGGMLGGLLMSQDSLADQHASRQLVQDSAPGPVAYRSRNSTSCL